MTKIYLAKYLEWLEKRNLSFQTIRSYHWSLKEYGSRELNTEAVIDFVKESLLKYQPSTLRTCLKGLISYAKFKKIEIEWELITKLIPTIQPKFFPTISEKELELLKKVKTRTSSLINRRNNLILDFLFWTGVRVKELINLRHSDYQDESLLIRGKGNKIRYVFIPKFLAKNFNGSPDYLFETWKKQKISDIQIWTMISHKAKKASLTKHISPHTFRRSFATLLNNRDCKLTAIQKFLGHSNLQTTANYIHNSREELYREYSKLWKNSLISTPPPPQQSIFFKK